MLKKLVEFVKNMYKTEEPQPPRRNYLKIKPPWVKLVISVHNLYDPYRYNSSGHTRKVIYIRNTYSSFWDHELVCGLIRNFVARGALGFNMQNIETFQFATNTIYDCSGMSVMATIEAFELTPNEKLLYCHE